MTQVERLVLRLCAAPERHMGDGSIEQWLAFQRLQAKRWVKLDSSGYGWLTWRGRLALWFR